MDAYGLFNRRTGHFLLEISVETVASHPDGEGNPELFVLVKGIDSDFADPMWWRDSTLTGTVIRVDDSVWAVSNPLTQKVTYVVSEDKPPSVTETYRVPTFKLDLNRLTPDARIADDIVNLYAASVMSAPLETDYDDYMAEVKKYDTFQNAILTIGPSTGTYATIAAAVAAASSGDILDEIDGATYTENVTFGGKSLHLRGTIGNMTATITKSSGSVLQLATAGDEGSQIENWSVVSTGSSYYGINVLKNSITLRRIKASGATSMIFRSTAGTCTIIECIAYDGAGTGIGATTDDTVSNCTVVGCLVGFNAASVTINPQLCVGIGNGTDFVGANALRSKFNVSSDGTAPGAASVTTGTTADFVNYATRDLRLNVGVLPEKFIGYPIRGDFFDAYNQLRKTDGIVYAGAHTPDPVAAVFPSPGEVAVGTGFYGPTGSDYTPTRVDATASNVLTGTGTYGDPGSPLTPSYAPDYPEVENVRTTDTVGGTPGTCTIPLAADLWIGVSVGAGGTEVTGSLDTPDLANLLDSDTLHGDSGTFNEASRNIGTAAANIRLGESIKIANVVTNGSLDPGTPRTTRTVTGHTEAKSGVRNV